MVLDSPAFGSYVTDPGELAFYGILPADNPKAGLCIYL